MLMKKSHTVLSIIFLPCVYDNALHLFFFSLQEQITQIKSDLLSVVNKEVQTLKETISKLEEENLELKLENEKLRNLVEFRNSTST